MISTAIRLARVGSGSELAAALLLGLSFPCVMLAAIIPNVWFFAAAAAVSYLADTFLHQRGSYLVNRLAKVRAGLSIRFLIRQMLLVLLVARCGLGEDRIFYVTVVAVLVFYGLQAPHGAIVTLLRLRRRLPVVTRNIDLGAIRIPDAPPPWLLSRSAEKMLHLDVFAMVGVIVTLQTRDNLYGYAGLGLSVLLAVGFIVALLPYLRPSRLVPNAEKVLTAVDGWLADYRPTVMLYFSGSKESAYQVNMWLETMGQLEGRPLIVLRERVIAQQLGPTAVPVLCVPGGVHLMNLDLSTVRVALYAANVGKNIHMLRVPTMKHVFIGHGDSDKLASVNPYSKAYDEVWTAGRAGRDRYALADVGVRDEDIVEVGRPQLAPIEPANGSTKNPIPTVLYAPTWEGWDDSPGNTSLLLAGENIVKRLLKAERPVRVLYKPHPFTGTRSAKAKAVHERIIALVEKAATERATDARWAKDAAGLRDEQSAARTELARIGARLTELSGGADASRDEAEESRDSKADPARQAELTRLRREWNGAYWRSFGWWEHRVIDGSEPALYDCFNESDAMVSDISSVVSDFIASGKPYAVTDSAELGAEEFKRQNTAVRAAVILSNSAKELDQLLTAVAEPSADPLAEARGELKRYLLGPDEPTSIERFDAAAQALAAKSLARNVGVEQRLTEPEEAPAPDDSAPAEPRAEDSPVGG
ncbi:CDP-glycerol glycerophosphotransferase family protein [Streptomyces sp. 35G-GA-8]|uniref:CDP-glycerol glycerophosphotransferase family protein n=1 Tax=Streptomyces sp. 35G-GA-8 TaxID=2939434 RepID=UPI00201F0535|nr:CDP-glycerol glycerophosphotransferase family protein [Streptomyces sp. 35G-GA-8]MCL7377344.1 CDP-glycerol glycerophosphotransferase family protein [Streptomyces sp. 35G-GA-8]